MEALPEHFCILPWVHLYINPEGEIIPCSKQTLGFYGNVKDTSLTSAWTSAAAEDFRSTMLSKNSSPRCRFCNHMRTAGNEPYHVLENRNYPDAIAAREWTTGSKLVGNAKIQFLEFRFSNVCNLRCRTCNPSFSTSWYREGAEIYGSDLKSPLKAFKSNGHFLSILNECLRHLKVVQILGGEPLVHDEFYLMLEKFIEAGRTDIRINVTTNFTRLRHKHWDFVKLARHFPNLYLTASLDGAGPQGEYIRKGSSWPDIEKNFKALEGIDVHFTIYPVISVLNAFHIVDAIERWWELGMLNESFNISRILNFVTDKPLHYNIRVLDSDERKKLKKHYAVFLQGFRNRANPRVYGGAENYLNSIIKFLDVGFLDEHRAEFQRITRILDHSRSEDFLSLFPELSSLYGAEK